MNVLKGRLLAAGLALVLAVAGRAHSARAADPAAAAARQPAPASAAAPEQPGSWPRTLEQEGIVFTVYQPQPTSWDGYRMNATAAVMAKTKEGEQTPVFGSIRIEATSLVDKDARTVTFQKIYVTGAKFPSLADKGERYQKLLAAAAKKVDASIRTLELDRLEGSLAIAKTQAATTANFVNDPPRIIFETTPTLLIYIDGTPVWREVPGTSLERVINTRPLLLRDKAGMHSLKVFDGWMQSGSLEGAWTTALHPAPELEQALKVALESKTVDPLTGTNPEKKDETPPSVKVNPPRISIATKPTELIVTDGAPKYVPVAGTDLLYIENTTGNVFKHTKDQQTYLLTAGRWFKAPSERGPWTFVAADQLPPDFRKIPDDSAKENVKASVAGTVQAEEAVVANSVPQTAQVDRKTAKFTPQIDGEPKFETIQGTSLARVINCSTPIIRVDPTHFFAVENGVWFSAAALAGPWVVAASVPTVIYTIPASSPIYYVTYVHVYDATPTTVVVGYTPGYYGTYVYGTTVVYGTGYYYPPYVGSVWYGPPVTYGFGVSMAYTPWTGWAFGFGFGWSWGHVSMCYGGWGWGPYPWWGPVGVGFYSPMYYPWAYRPGAGAVWGPRPGGGAVWGPSGWAASTGNVYHRWGATSAVTRSSGGYNAWTGNSWSNEVGRSYNSRTGTLAAGQRSSVANVYTGNYRSSSSGAAVNTKTGASAVGGSVTRGNAYTGNQVSAGGAVVRNGAGEATAIKAVGNGDVGAAKIGDDLYVKGDGGVAKRDANGNWQEQNAKGGWDRVDQGAQTKSDLDRASQQRQQGERRTQNYSSGAHRSLGFGGGGGRGRR